MVLGTEMKSHFEHLNKFKSRAAADGFCTGEDLERKDMRLLLLMALHAADMSNPTKPIALAIEWAARAMDEFFSQVMMPPPHTRAPLGDDAPPLFSASLELPDRT